MITGAQQDVLTAAAVLRKAAAEYQKRWDEYFAVLAKGEPADYSTWRDLETSKDQLLRLAEQLRDRETAVRNEAYRDEMAERARARHRKAADR